MNFLLELLKLIQKLIKNGTSMSVQNVSTNQTLNPINPDTTSLILTRKWYNANAVIGELSVNDVFECFTLEGPSVVIPCGTYPIELTYSPKFDRILPLIDNVPDRTAIRIHPGNSAKDTEGCLLVGASHDDNDVYQSVIAFENLFEKLKEANSIQITIK